MKATYPTICKMWCRLTKTQKYGNIPHGIISDAMRQYVKGVKSTNDPILLLQRVHNNVVNNTTWTELIVLCNILWDPIRIAFKRFLETESITYEFLQAVSNYSLIKFENIDDWLGCYFKPSGMSKLSGFSNPVAYAFNWYTSKQGNNYWQKVNRKWYEYLKVICY